MIGPQKMLSGINEFFAASDMSKLALFFSLKLTFY